MKRNFLKSVKSKRAETILEVTVALFIVGIGLATVSMVVNRVLNVTTRNELFLHGSFFAKEGIEAVRNIRDTNWLRYPSECWATIQTTSTCDPTGPMLTVGPGYYSTCFDFAEFTWELNPASGPLIDTDVLFRNNNEYRIYKEYFTSIPTYGEPVYTGQTLGFEPTDYYRMIEVEPVNGVDFDDDGSDPNQYDGEAIKVTSTVKWPYKNEVFSYSVSVILTNFQE